MFWSFILAQLLVIFIPMLAVRFLISENIVLNIVKFFQTHSAPPSVIADAIFASAGRLVIVDQGLVTVIFKLITKLVDWNFLAWIMSRNACHQADFKRVKNANVGEKKVK